MRKLVFLLFAMVFFVSASAASAGDVKTSRSNPLFVPDEVIVIYDKNITAGKKSGIRNAYGLVKKKDSKKPGKFTVYKHKNPTAIINSLKNEPGVLHVEQNAYAYATATVDDPYFSYQWHMTQIGVETAWEQSTGAGVVVAVIDTGIKQSLKDLAGTNFTAGYDFVNNDTDPTDDQGHGSHVCGTIAQTTNNGLGVAGVAYNATIMPVKVLNELGTGTYDDIADGITWATDNGADVINLSLGGYGNLQILENAIDYAWSNGVVVVCAAGNDNTSNPHYPSAYSNSISVSASTSQNTKASYSNYGDTIDIAAPGGDSGDFNDDGYNDMVLQNTFSGANEGYYFFAGTSMASPHVAGVAALIKSKNQNLTNIEIRSILENTADDQGETDWDGWGILNAAAAVGNTDGDMGGDITPPVISNITSTVTSDSATITWITDEPADSTVDYGTDNSYGMISSDNTMATSHQIVLTDLNAATTYHYKVGSSDEAGNPSASGDYTFTTDPGITDDTYIFVDEITMSLKKAGKNYFAIAVVTIKDHNNYPVSGATVNGTWSGLASESSSGVTGTDGKIALQSPKARSIGTFTFTVDTVTGPYPYDSNGKSSELIDN